MYKLKNKLDRLLFSTVRIETENSVGTGFIAHFNKMEKLKNLFFLVTNKHVLDGKKSLKIKLHSINSFNVEEKTVDLSQHEEITYNGNLQDIAFYHPRGDIDIALIDLNKLFSKNLPMFIPIALDEHIIEGEAEHFSAVEQVFFSGYPNGLIDEENLLPIVRRGITATPYQIDFKGQPIFLIDGSVFPGSSGSPVFLADHNQTLVDMDGTGLKPFSLGKDRFHLLGIIARVYTRNERFDVKVIDIPTSEQSIVAVGEQMLDIGIVYKATEILKLARFFLFEKVVEPTIELIENHQDTDDQHRETLKQAREQVTIDDVDEIKALFAQFLGE